MELNETWLIVFEDTDHQPEAFTSEESARRTFEERKLSWNCHLFRRAESRAETPDAWRFTREGMARMTPDERAGAAPMSARLTRGPKARHHESSFSQAVAEEGKCAK
jgi:hypothetical protein